MSIEVINGRRAPTSPLDIAINRTQIARPLSINGIPSLGTRINGWTRPVIPRGIAIGIPDTASIADVPLWHPACSVGNGGTFQTFGRTAITCTVAGAIWRPTGGYSFDATNDYISVAHNAVLANPFDVGGGIIAWFKANSDGQNDLGMVVDKSEWQVSALEEGAGFIRMRLRYSFSGSTAVWKTTDQVVSLGVWHQIAVFYLADDVANDPVIYIDGASVAITEVTAPSGTRIADTGTVMMIGNFNNPGAFPRCWDGVIGKVRILPATSLNASYVANDYLANRWRYK